MNATMIGATAIALLLCVAVPVQADDFLQGAYVGLRGGYAHNSFDEDRMAASLRARGHNVRVSSDAGDLTATLFGGIILSPAVAAEFGLGYLGEFHIDVRGSSSAPAAVLVADLAQAQPKTGGYAAYAALRIRSELGHGFALVTRVGPYVYFRESDISASGTRFSNDEDGVGLLFGTGLGYEINPQLSLSADWQLLRPTGEGVQNNLTAGLEYRVR